MPYQTSISDDPAIAYAGQLTHQFPGGKESKAAEGALVAGQPALRGTDPDTQAIAIANSDTVDESTLLGFVVLETSRPYDPTNPIADTDPVTIVRKGRFAVQTSEAVTAGTQVFVGNLTAQLGNIGNTGVGMVAAPGCRYVTSTTAAGLAIVEINLPAS